MSASTPQGCVWNTFRSASDIARPSASTPQGCVWNRGTTASTPACVRASTPQGCVWNTGDGVTCSMTAVLQPHKGASGTAAEETPTNAVWASTPQGCVWNHAGITGYTCCRGRTHTSVSVDPQFTPNPWGSTENHGQWNTILSSSFPRWECTITPVICSSSTTFIWCPFRGVVVCNG